MVNSRFRIFFSFFLRGFLTITQKKGEKIDSSIDAHLEKKKKFLITRSLRSPVQASK